MNSIRRQCLVKAVQANEDDHPTVASLYKATYGILFFATPHKGLLVADMRKMLASQQDHPRHALLEEIDRTSNLLTYQLADFKNLIRDRKIVSFFETQQTRQLEWVRRSGTRLTSSSLANSVGFFNFIFRTLKAKNGVVQETM